MDRRDTIVGYRYGTAADIVCSQCIFALCADVDLTSRMPETTEELLDRRAVQLGIRRQDTRTYTSREFPQPIYLDEATETDSCVYCRQRLLDDTSQAA
jgi:hypothetical protein